MLSVGNYLLNILTVNCNGIRTKSKRLELSDILDKLCIGACVVVETHLREDEKKRVKFPNYTIVTASCRDGETKKIGGGVLIMVHKVFRADKDVSIELESQMIEHCSVRLYPSARHDAALLLTGLYFPPRLTRGLDLNVLAAIGGVVKNPHGGSLPAYTGRRF